MELDILDGRNELDWNDGVLADNFDVCIDGNCNLSTLTSDYIDLSATCNEDICYRVIANYPNGAVSTSFERCGTAFSNATPEAIKNLITERDIGQVNIEWADPINFTPDSYSILKSFRNDIDGFFTGVTSPYIDVINNELGTYCYKLSYTDICGNSSPAPNEVCSIYLNGVLENDNSATISWNSYIGYEMGVLHYRVEKYDENGFLQSSFTTTNTSFTDGNDITVFQIARYKVFAVPNDASLAESYSNEFKVIKRSVVSHPKAFTPNGDGLNDEYKVYGTYIKTFNLKVYNRWGELIFVTNDISKGWDGTYDGEQLPSGSYTYSSEITDLANRTYSLSGFFALIRN